MNAVSFVMILSKTVFDASLFVFAACVLSAVFRAIRERKLPLCTGLRSRPLLSIRLRKRCRRRAWTVRLVGATALPGIGQGLHDPGLVPGGKLAVP